MKKSNNLSEETLKQMAQDRELAQDRSIKCHRCGCDCSSTYMGMKTCINCIDTMHIQPNKKKYMISESYIAAETAIIKKPEPFPQAQFWQQVETQTRQVASKNPDKFDQLLAQVREHLESGIGPITIGNKTFEIIVNDHCQMSKKEIKARELFEKFRPFVYGFVGSSFITGTEYPSEIVRNSIQVALLSIHDTLSAIPMYTGNLNPTWELYNNTKILLESENFVTLLINEETAKHENHRKP
jgi:hypothetical protein